MADIERMRKLVFRATKGKSFIFTKEFDPAPELGEDLINSKITKKAVYIITYWDGTHIRARLEKICDSFKGQRYDLPPSNGEIQQKIARITQDISNARNVLGQTMKILRDQLIDFDSFKPQGQDMYAMTMHRRTSNIYLYKMFLAREQAMYSVLNMLKQQRQICIGYFWAPKEEQPKIIQRMGRFSAVRIVEVDN